MTRNHWFVLELVIDTLSVTMCSAQRIHLSNRTSFPSLNCSKLKLKSIITHSLLCYDRSYGMQAVITMLKYSSFILSAINDILTIWDLRSTRYHAITIFSNLKNDVLEGGKGFFFISPESVLNPCHLTSEVFCQRVSSLDDLHPSMTDLSLDLTAYSAAVAADSNLLCALYPRYLQVSKAGNLNLASGAQRSRSKRLCGSLSCAVVHQLVQSGTMLNIILMRKYAWNPISALANFP